MRTKCSRRFPSTWGARGAGDGTGELVGNGGGRVVDGGGHGYGGVCAGGGAVIGSSADGLKLSSIEAAFIGADKKSRAFVFPFRSVTERSSNARWCSKDYMGIRF